MIEKIISSIGKNPRREKDAGYGERLPPGQHTVENWPVLTYGPAPSIRTDEWKFRVFGLVEEKRTWTFDEFLSLGKTTVHADFHCVTSFSVMDNDWEGIPVSALMRDVQPLPECEAVMVHCFGGYTTNLSLDDINRSENLFALLRNGEPLSKDHGGPVRLIVPHLYAWKSAKWVSGLEFIRADRPGFWEVNGYHMRGDPFLEERYS